MQIGITLGDPAGIGPEIVRALLADPLPPSVRVTVFGHRAALPSVQFDERVALVEPPSPLVVAPGQPNLSSAQAQVAYLEAAADALASGRLAGVVTAPIHKHEAQRGGFRFPGHTEFFASLGGRVAERPVTMSFVGPRLRLALATAHCSLREAIARIVDDPSRVTRAAVHLAELLRDGLRIDRPRIAVAALNPHAGESGQFGDEEAGLRGAIAEAQRRCPWAELGGPCVPDVVFRQALVGAPDQRWDAVVALYHDQGLIPAKLLDFDATVNVTLGLPFVRTSPDHGTAYDIAGRGLARADSLRAAFALCVQLVAGAASKSGLLGA